MFDSNTQAESPRILLCSRPDNLCPHHGQILDSPACQNRFISAEDSNVPDSGTVANVHRDRRKKSSAGKHQKIEGHRIVPRQAACHGPASPGPANENTDGDCQQAQQSRSQSLGFWLSRSCGGEGTEFRNSNGRLQFTDNPKDGSSSKRISPACTRPCIIRVYDKK